MTRYQKVKRYKRAHVWLSKKIDAFFTWGSNPLPMCGNGKRHNWSVMLADLFFVGCACCIFYRGVIFGAALAALIASLI
jgi:hypothetical protein